MSMKKKYKGMATMAMLMAMCNYYGIPPRVTPKYHKLTKLTGFTKVEGRKHMSKRKRKLLKQKQIMKGGK